MQNITATQDTWLKLRPADSSSLTSDKLKFVKAGQSIEVATLGRKLEKGHYSVILVKPVAADFGSADSHKNEDGYLQGPGFYNWWIFPSHWRLPKAVGMQLDVPFYPQTDNLHEPHRTCNTSVHAMLAEFIKPGCIKGSDDNYYQIVRRFGDTTDHTAQTKALETLGIKSSWFTDLSFKDIDRQLDKLKPVPLGILHRGSLYNPTGGHIILVVGRYSGGYLCHDPYGDLLDGYTSDVCKGEFVKYSRKVLTYRWLGGPENVLTGWGRLC